MTLGISEPYPENMFKTISINKKMTKLKSSKLTYGEV